MQHAAVCHHVWQRRATGPGPLNSRHRLAHSPRHTPSSHVSGTRCGSRVNLRAGGVLTSGEGSPLVPCRRKRQETRGRSSHPKGRQVYNSCPSVQSPEVDPGPAAHTLSFHHYLYCTLRPSTTDASQHSPHHSAPSAGCSSHTIRPGTSSDSIVHSMYCLS